MNKLICLLWILVISKELIVDFDYYASKVSLYSSLPVSLQSSLTLLDAPESWSNFILVGSLKPVDFEGVPHVLGVYPQKSLEQKSLRFLSEANGNKVTELVEAQELWKEGYTGKGQRIAILDSGMHSADMAYVSVTECINFTDEPDCEDSTGHGTFMASIISSNYSECPGLAPDAEVYVLKVFNSAQQSLTSWFLEAFNFVKLNNINILNLSNGGINFMDEPFVSRISEMVSEGVVVVSAAGNDGPGFGTLSNPGDQPEVIGVGGLDETGMHVAEFSSRGPSLWEIYGGMGRFKPDIVTFSVNIKGIYRGRCLSNSGTSISAPIVAGSIALINLKSHSPAMIKNALMKSADRILKDSIFQQGAGKLNLLKAKKYLESEDLVRLHSFPSYFDNGDSFFYPYSLQPLFPKSPPLVLNFTIFHPNVPDGYLQVTSINASAKLSVRTEVTQFKAFTASLSVFISTKQFVNIQDIKITLESSDLLLEVPIRVKVGKSPFKEQRVLWDLGHNLKFPEAGPIIRDELEGPYLLDWRGDHPFTNHLYAYETMVNMGFIVDFLYDDFSCIDGSLYSTYLIIDPEKNLSDYEISKIQYDMEMEKVSLIIFAEWSDSKTLETQLAYSNFTEGLPGSNINTINSLLSPYFIELSASKSFSDTGRIGSQKFSYQQGTEITRFPAGGYLVTQVFQDPRLNKFRDVGIIGMIQVENFRISVFGDSSCLDPLNVKYDCLWLLKILLEFSSSGHVELEENFRLPFDYDIHVEEEHQVFQYYDPLLSQIRSFNLQCQKSQSAEVLEFEPYSHLISNKKIRIWAPLREIEPFDMVGIVQVATFLIFVLLFTILLCTRYKSKHSGRIRPLV